MDPAEYARMRAAEDTHWWYAGLHEILLRHLPALPPEARVLDAGCGTGGVLARLAHHFREMERSHPTDGQPVRHVTGVPGSGRAKSPYEGGFRGVLAPSKKTGPCPVVEAVPTRRLVGMDPAPEALGPAGHRRVATLARAALPDLPFAPACFDLALCVDVLYHRAVPDPSRALRALHDVLRPGGWVLLNVPAYAWLRAAHDEPIHTARRFTRGEVRALLAAAGLRPVRVTHWNSLLLPAIVPLRLASRGRGDSDLRHPPGALQHRIAAAALAVERRVLRHTDLPFGLSIFAAAQRPV